MRARGAYIRSFGVTGLLVTAAFIMLAIVSAIVAFNGWPSDAAASRVDSVALDVPVATSAPEATVVLVRPDPPAAQRAASATRTRASRAASGSRAAPTALTVPPDSLQQQSAPAPAPAPEPAPAAQPAPEAPAAPAAPAAPRPGDTLGAVTGTVESLTGSVTETVAPVISPR
jgi:hypothetical protein